MELSNQEMELFLLFPDLGSKNFLNKIFTIFTKESKSSFTNKKWNHPNRKWNYFSFPDLGSKNFFNKIFTIFTVETKSSLTNRKYSNRKWNYCHRTNSTSTQPQLNLTEMDLT